MRKKTSMITILTVLFLVAASYAAAHPPTSIELDYSRDDGILGIWIGHVVGNTSSHFTEEVEVKVGGREAAELRYVSQGDRSGERIVVTIGRFAPGTRIEVKAECNRSGNMTGVLVVE